MFALDNPGATTKLWAKYAVYGVECHIYNSVIHHILRRMLGNTDDQRLHHYNQLMTLGIQVPLLISWHEYVQQCYNVYAYIAQWSTSWLKYTQITFVISILNNIFLLHAKI